MITHLGVIIPAHNEEDEILGCLDSVLQSFAHVPEASVPGGFQIVVVVDACTDATLGLVLEFARHCRLAKVLTTSSNSVGSARDVGCSYFMRSVGGVSGADFDTAWVAFTDADSRVPLHWISSHLEVAAEGADCLVGTVAPRPESGSAELIAKWHANHELGENHSYVFGANLGLRGSCLAAIGGVPRLTCGEDAAIVAAVRTVGGQLRRTDSCRVLTSARLTGRTQGGFSGYLQQLA